MQWRLILIASLPRFQAFWFRLKVKDIFIILPVPIGKYHLKSEDTIT